MVTKYILAVLFALMFMGCSLGDGKGERMGRFSGTILALGDSLTEGYGVAEEESYPALLQEKLQRNGYDCQVMNAGRSGEFSSGAANRLEMLLMTEQSPDIVILETGVNDGLQGYDPTRTEANIDAILGRLSDEKISVLFTGMKIGAYYGPQHLRRFNELYPRLAKKYDVVYMPFFLEGVAMQPKLNLSDGIHPNAAGYKIITDNIYPYVKETIERYQER